MAVQHQPTFAGFDGAKSAILIHQVANYVAVEESHVPVTFSSAKSPPSVYDAGTEGGRFTHAFTSSAAV